MFCFYGIISNDLEGKLISRHKNSLCAHPCKFSCNQALTFQYILAEVLIVAIHQRFSCTQQRPKTAVLKDVYQINISITADFLRQHRFVLCPTQSFTRPQVITECLKVKEVSKQWSNSCKSGCHWFRQRQITSAFWSERQIQHLQKMCYYYMVTLVKTQCNIMNRNNVKLIYKYARSYGTIQKHFAHAAWLLVVLDKSTVQTELIKLW